jgi:maltooligosyltrehalose trehalohydrolase
METVMFDNPQQRLGATYVENEGVYIRLWAPFMKNVQILWNESEPQPLMRDEDGYFTGFFPDAKTGDRYIFLENNHRFADPASRYQPDGVFGSSCVVAQDYTWTDQNWRGVPFPEWVIYEIHVGTFSARHNFQGIIDDLARLKNLGITTLEIMPISQFSGDRNWGYDGVFPHAVQNTYGGPEGFKALIDTAHAHGMSVILDVVYNHIGPEGNTLFACGPYTQTKYSTPWGDALNFDGEHNHHLRRYFLQSAWQWLTEYHLDGLRLDAIQTMFDASPIPFLEDLSKLKREAEKKTGRTLILTAETDANDSRILAAPEHNGFGIDAQWADDLHHAVHAILTGEKKGYYADYGDLSQLARIYERGVAYEGAFSVSRRRPHGRSYEGTDKKRLIVETQNHDQTGNRMKGERLSMLLDKEKLKLAAACILLSPFTPLIFMGEELASQNPFLYFTSHTDKTLNENIRKGRAKEWQSFGWDREILDPSQPDTFNQCVLTEKGEHPMQDYYRDLIAFSKALRQSACVVSYKAEHKCILLDYSDAGKTVVLNFSDTTENPDIDGTIVFQSTSYPARPGREALPPFSASIFERGTA